MCGRGWGGCCFASPLRVGLTWEKRKQQKSVQREARIRPLLQLRVPVILSIGDFDAGLALVRRVGVPWLLFVGLRLRGHGQCGAGAQCYAVRRLGVQGREPLPSSWQRWFYHCCTCRWGLGIFLAAKIEQVQQLFKDFFNGKEFAKTVAWLESIPVPKQ